MAITLTTAEAALAIRVVSDPANIPDAIDGVLKIMIPAASAIVLDYAPQAPDAVHNAAMIRLLGWLYEADPTDSRISRAIVVSGAAPLLARWKVARAGAITPAAAPATPPASGIPPAPANGHWILTSNDGALAWVEFPAP